ncbi:caspase family protein, partial [bacterium]|nr:caspase family protein [bacterium]
MRAKSLASVLILLMGLYPLCAQVIKSDSASIILNFRPKADPTKPGITIVTPAIPAGAIYKTNEAKVELVGKITNLQGTIVLYVNSKKTEVDKLGTFKSAIWLEKEGVNEITLLAFDQNNRVEEKIDLEYESPEMALINQIKNEAIYYALVIGVDEYSDKQLSSLDNPVNDAEKLMKVLTSEYTFQPDNVIYLKNARKDDILESLEMLRKKVTVKDNLLIFYAGHGYWDDKSNVGYWLPSDAREDSRNTWLSNSNIVDYLKEIQAKHILLIADACFSGAIFKSRAVIADRKETLQNLNGLKSRKAMTSGALTLVPDRSAFSRYLIEKLGEKKERIFTAEELFSSFQGVVENNSDVAIKPRFGEIQN